MALHRTAVVDKAGKCSLFRYRNKVHKLRNVLGHLPERLHASVSKALRDAWDLESADRAARVLKRLAGSLERDHPGAAASIREGLEETLTVQRLGLTGSLERTLRTTNIIENLMGSVEGYTRRVKRWRGGQMIQRWVASALVEAEPRFRRVRGYRDLRYLVGPWTHWPRPTARLLTWRRIDDYGAETGSPSLAKFNNERDNPSVHSSKVIMPVALITFERRMITFGAAVSRRGASPAVASEGTPPNRPSDGGRARVARPSGESGQYSSVRALSASPASISAASAPAIWSASTCP